MSQVGKRVRLRTVDDDPISTTGVYLGDFPWEGSPVLNPAIWCPDLKRVVRGYECWWDFIPDDVAAPEPITEEEIANSDTMQLWRYLLSRMEAPDSPTGEEP